MRHALAGVGENLSDHYTPRIVARVKSTRTINNLAHGPRLARRNRASGPVGRPSILGLSAALVYAFGKSRPERWMPPTSPSSSRRRAIAKAISGKLDAFPGMTSGAWQMRPLSTGHVRIGSADPLAAPLIQPNYLAQEEDRRVLLVAIRTARRILATPELAPYYEHEQQPGAGHTTDDELLDFARRFGSSCYHYAGTCRMGPESDPSAVVDDELKVSGLEGLRVVDASVMPTDAVGEYLCVDPGDRGKGVRPDPRSGPREHPGAQRIAAARGHRAGGLIPCTSAADRYRQRFLVGNRRPPRLIVRAP